MRPLICLIFMLLAAGGAQAQATVALLPGWAEPGGGRVAGLAIRLAPGWKTYWRSPGEGGLPPVFDWSSSRNLRSVAVEWPAPTVDETYGMISLVYAADVVLPLVVVAEDPALPVSLVLSLSFGVCADICVPAQADVSLDLPPGAPPRGEQEIRTHRARVPLTAAEGGVVEAACGVSGAGVERRFETRVLLDRPARRDPTVVVEGPAEAWFEPVAVRREGAAIVGSGAVQVYGEGVWIGRDALRLTLLWQDRAIDISECQPMPR
jgi:DsbC/DsbD-like thiol-disulfide interchange protein